MNFVDLIAEFAGLAVTYLIIAIPFAVWHFRKHDEDLQKEWTIVQAWREYFELGSSKRPGTSALFFAYLLHPMSSEGAPLKFKIFLWPLRWAVSLLADSVIQRHLDLPEVNLPSNAFNYTGLSLAGYSFAQANLQNALFIATDLRDTNFGSSTLIEAVFYKADLRSSFLGNANLRRADFSAANLDGADLAGADIRATNFQSTKGLTRQQLTLAIGNSSTKLPPNLEEPDSWKN